MRHEGTRPRAVGVAGVGRVEGEPELAVRDQVGAVGEADRALRALLDEQHRHAAAADLGERLEDDVDDLRREAERGLVEEEQPRPGDERAGDRELLLLAARERPRVPAPELAHDREQLVDRVDVGRRARSRRCRAASPSRRFSSTVRSPKIRRPSGTSATPGAGDLLRGAAAERAPGEPDVATRPAGARP